MLSVWRFCWSFYWFYSLRKALTKAYLLFLNQLAQSKLGFAKGLSSQCIMSTLIQVNFVPLLLQGLQCFVTRELLGFTEGEHVCGWLASHRWGAGNQPFLAGLCVAHSCPPFHCPYIFLFVFFFFLWRRRRRKRITKLLNI